MADKRRAFMRGACIPIQLEKVGNVTNFVGEIV